MTTIKTAAAQYVPPTTKNITELKSVSVDLEIVEATYNDKDGKPFTVNEITVNGEKYRVPVTVIASLKAILKVKPDMKTFSVTKTGEGLNTQYTVIPL